MWEELLKYDKLGSKDELSILLFEILSFDQFKKIDDVKTICIHQSYTFGSSFNGIICLLNLLELINVQGNLIKADTIVSKYKPEIFFSKGIIFERLFKALKDVGKLETLFNYQNTKLDNETKAYYIKDSLIPFSFISIKKLLINTEFLVNPKNIQNTYFINPVFKSIFSLFVISNIKKSSEKLKITLEKLKCIQFLQNEYGEQAEDYVLNYELNRLSKHPSKQDIKKISAEFVNAGFDIESFNTEDSIINDRLIEVKSYSRDVSFYWSKNEIDTAKDIEDRYFLYLVDRSKIDQKDYEPYIIKDPYKNLFLNDNWQKNTATYFVSKLSK